MEINKDKVQLHLIITVTFVVVVRSTPHHSFAALFLHSKIKRLYRQWRTSKIIKSVSNYRNLTFGA